MEYETLGVENTVVLGKVDSADVLVTLRKDEVGCVR